MAEYWPDSFLLSDCYFATQQDATLSLWKKIVPRESGGNGAEDCVGQHLKGALHNVRTRADKGWAVKRARPSKKVSCSGLGLCLEMSLVFDFGQGLRYDVVCTLDTAAVSELWRLELFS